MVIITKDSCLGPSGARTGQSGVPQRVIAFPPMAISSWGLYILHPTGHLKVWEPKQHGTHAIDISKCSDTQVLNRITQ
jgi:hypothetical protein